MTSIIIPAHNEEGVIERCLRPFLDVAKQGAVEVIVVCNGCSDQTARKVSKLSESFACLETDIASKANALNIGDVAAHSFPRIYLDADVSLSLDAVGGLCRMLDKGYLATAPEVKMNLDGSSWFVKSYYDVWFALPYCQAGMIGAGVYALSKAGRERFSRFPNIIADDGYVRCLFNESERGIARGYHSIVNAPKTVSGLIRIKTRSRLGRYQLKATFPELLKNEEKNYAGAIRKVALDPKLSPKLLLYLLVNLTTRARARWQAKRNLSGWERDESSRKNCK